MGIGPIWGITSLTFILSWCQMMCDLTAFKDGTKYCYCAYVLHISGYSGFQWVVPTNTGIFLHCLKLFGESRTQQVLLVSKKKIGGNHAFSEIIKLNCLCFSRIVIKWAKILWY